MLIDLKRIINLKNLRILIAINLLNDVMSLSFYDLKQITSSEELSLLFGRYFCTDINIITFTQFISFYSFIVFCVVNIYREDYQNIGTFYLVRFNRAHYVFAKLGSSTIFIYFVCMISAFQSCLTHKIMKINISNEQYAIVLTFSFLIALFGVQISLFTYSLSKSSNISFLSSFFVLTIISIYINSVKLKLPTEKNIPIQYTYPALISLFLIMINYFIIKSSDFIISKRKE